MPAPAWLCRLRCRPTHAFNLAGMQPLPSCGRVASASPLQSPQEVSNHDEQHDTGSRRNRARRQRGNGECTRQAGRAGSRAAGRSGGAGRRCKGSERRRLQPTVGPVPSAFPAILRACGLFRLARRANLSRLATARSVSGAVQPHRLIPPSLATPCRRGSLAGAQSGMAGATRRVAR